MMILRPVKIHPESETQIISLEGKNELMELDTFGGKLHVEWDNDAAVTSIGQLSFFIQFLNLNSSVKK